MYVVTYTLPYVTDPAFFTPAFYGPAICLSPVFPIIYHIPISYIHE